MADLLQLLVNEEWEKWDAFQNDPSDLTVGLSNRG